MALSVSVTPREESMIKELARLQGQTVSSFIKESLMRRIEAEIDPAENSGSFAVAQCFFGIVMSIGTSRTAAAFLRISDGCMLR